MIDAPSNLDPDIDLLLARGAEDTAVLQQVLTTIKETCSSAVVLPSMDLMTALTYLRFPTVQAAFAEDYVDARLLTYVSAKMLWGDIFGISKVMPWGVRIHSELVNTNDQRPQALASVTHFAKTLGIRAKYSDAIELVLDELLMNALYNAPVDAEGHPLFMEVAPKERSALRLERPVILQVACDGARFAVSVRDSFGSLRRSTILDYLERCAQTSDQIDRKTSGAGLGLYLVTNNVTEFIANLLPGTATEIICIFDIKAPRQQLKHFGIFEETTSRAAEPQRIDRPSKLFRPPVAAGAPRMSKVIPLTLATAVALLLVSGILLVWPYLQSAPTGNIEVTASPSESTVYINGVRRGVASPSLTIKDLDVATTYAVTARFPGYDEAQEVVTVSRGETLQVKLNLVRQMARIKLSSSPSGAQILLDDKPTGQETPALLEGLEPSKKVAVRFRKHGFKDSTESITPTALETLRLHVNLSLAPGFAQLSLSSNPGKARLYVNNVDTGAVTPVKGHVLRAEQPYSVKLALEKYVSWEQRLQPKEGDHIVRAVKLLPGGHLSISSNIRAQVSVGNYLKQTLPLRNRVVPAGSYRVALRANNPYLSYGFTITIKAGEKAGRHLSFGMVHATRKTLRIRVDKKRVSKLALMPGEHEITLLDTRTNQSRNELVKIEAGKTVVLE